MTTIGLLHPGEMGASVGASGRANGHRVLWTSEGRGADTGQRAAAAGLEDAGTLAALVAASEVILSVCPPHAALDVAGAVAAQRFRGIYVDGNAVSPATARSLARKVTTGAMASGGAMAWPRRSSGSRWVIRVSAVGEIQFTVTPYFAMASAVERVSPTMPSFAAE